MCVCVLIYEHKNSTQWKMFYILESISFELKIYNPSTILNISYICLEKKKEKDMVKGKKTELNGRFLFYFNDFGTAHLHN